MPSSYAEYARQLLEHHPKDRSDAAKGIAELGLTGGPEEPIIIPRLGRSLDETDWRVRKAAADALGDLCTPKFWGRDPSSSAALAIPELVKRLADGDIHARRALKAPLKKLTKSGHLGDVSDINRIAAPAIYELIKRLRDEDWRVRECAAKAIGDLETSALPAITDLVECLADNAMRVRAASKEALEKLYNSRAIVHVSMVGGAAIPALVEKLDHEDWRVSSAAAWALGQVGGCHVIGGLQLQKDVSDDNWAVRLLAIEALGEVGCCALAAIPDIAMRITDDQERVRAAAKNALAKMSALLHSRCLVPVPAVQRLARITYAQPKEDALSQTPKSMMAQTKRRAKALMDLADLGQIALPAVPDIMRALVDDKKEVILAAQEALRVLGQQGVFGVLGYVAPTMISSLNIELANKPPPEVVPELLKCLDDDHWAVRFGAAEALSSLVIRASYVIPKLKQHTQDGEMRLNVAAQRMLQRLEQAGAMIDIDSMLPDVLSELSDRMQDEDDMPMTVDSHGNQDEYKTGRSATLNLCDAASSAMGRLFQAGLLRSPETASTAPDAMYGIQDTELGELGAAMTVAVERYDGTDNNGTDAIDCGAVASYGVNQSIPGGTASANEKLCCPSCLSVPRAANKFCGKCGARRPEGGWPLEGQAEQFKQVLDNAGVPGQVQEYLQARGLVTKCLLARSGETEDEFIDAVVAPFMEGFNVGDKQFKIHGEDPLLVKASLLVAWDLSKMQSPQAPSEVTVTFQPGPLGFTRQEGRGIVVLIQEGQAQREGVKVGWSIKAVNGQACENFDDEVFEEAKNGEEPYEVTFSTVRAIEPSSLLPSD